MQIFPSMLKDIMLRHIYMICMAYVITAAERKEGIIPHILKMRMENGIILMIH